MRCAEQNSETIINFGKWGIAGLRTDSSSSSLLEIKSEITGHNPSSLKVGVPQGDNLLQYRGSLQKGHIVSLNSHEERNNAHQVSFSKPHIAYTLGKV